MRTTPFAHYDHKTTTTMKKKVTAITLEHDDYKLTVKLDDDVIVFEIEDEFYISPGEEDKLIEAIKEIADACSA